MKSTISYVHPYARVGIQTGTICSENKSPPLTTFPDFVEQTFRSFPKRASQNEAKGKPLVFAISMVKPKNFAFAKTLLHFDNAHIGFNINLSGGLVNKSNRHTQSVCSKAAQSRSGPNFHDVRQGDPCVSYAGH